MEIHIYASNYQSGIGDIESGSGFSFMQSMGACGGIPCLLFIGFLFGISAGICAGIYAWSYF